MNHHKKYVNTTMLGMVGCLHNFLQLLIGYWCQFPKDNCKSYDHFLYKVPTDKV